MNRNFGNIDFYELWLKYQVIVKKITFISIPIILILIIIFNVTANPYQKLEDNLLSKAKSYINDNDVEVTETFYLDMIILNENGYYVEYSNDIECNMASGVRIEKINNQIQYTPYLICDDYQSSAVKEITNKNSSYIKLKGDNPVIINDEEIFNDPGFTNSSNYTVEVNNQISDAPNLYIVTYSVKESDIVKDILSRIVILTHPSEDELEDTAYHKGLKLKLLGDQEIFIEQGKTYKELGASATDYKDGDISSKVEIYGTVDTSTINDTTLKYVVTNSSGVRLEVKRVIHVTKPVIEMNITSKLSTTNYTNSDVTITLTINSPYYRRTLLPNQLINYSSTINYKVTTNGTYTFRVYDDYGDYQDKMITVNNINKNPPSGTCIITSSGNTSTVNVSSSSSLGIVGYSYSDGTDYTGYTSSNQYTFNKKINVAYVKIKDQASNIKVISCKTNTPVITTNKVEYHFINSGRVDAILIRSGNHAAFVDGGWPSDGIKAVTYLKALGITKLDFVIGSHSHLNHVGALGDVVDNFEVGTVYFVENPLNCKYCNAGAYNSVNAAMKKKGIKATIQHKGDIFYLGDIKFECLAPIIYRKTGNIANYNSLNHLVTFGETKLLLTGDYMDKESLTNTYPADKLNIDILKYPHHGNYGISQAFLDLLSPSYVILQNSRDELGMNAAKSKKMLEEANLKMYQNYLDGNIVVISDGKNIEVKTNVDPNTFKNNN